MRRLTSVLFTILLLTSPSLTMLRHASAQPKLPAFPGAEGFGAAATGGRGGRVVIVRTLEPYGPGSLGEALDPEVCEPRIIVFRVSGVIEGEFDLTCGNVTIAGQTAPGAGITILGRVDGYDAAPGGNIIIRHVRIRTTPAPEGKGNFWDAVQLSNNPRVILDHVSASWGVDETIDFFEGTGNVTIQWSTIEESRTDGHPEGPHNTGFIAGPDVAGVSIHHVLFAHHRARCPALATGPAEVINTVIYDCQDGFVHHNPADGEFHIVGNTHRKGPSSERFTPFFFDDEDQGGVRYWLKDNRIDDPGELVGVVDDIWSRPYAHPGFEYAGGEEFAIDSPTDFAREGDGYVPVTVESARAAYNSVLRGAGAFPRDVVTARTIQEAQDRTGGWGASVPSDLLQGLTPASPPADGDDDGMADTWESRHGLSLSNGRDHSKIMRSGYTAIEEYVNELADGLIRAAGVEQPGDRARLQGKAGRPPRAVPIGWTTRVGILAVLLLAGLGASYVSIRRRAPRRR